ncbi:MAG: flagellar basal body-associated FliL family protein [Treponema sp.]|jgi:flagellar FliL protein|nr:flagellar basal body-associated FliL family protein [Treponema sp.]
MSDTGELDLEGGEAGGIDSGAKKTSGLAALLPNLLKFVAIGLGALVFIVTVSVITYNILNKGGRSQTVIPESSPYVGARPEYNYFSAIGLIRATTRDEIPHAVVVDMIIGYDMGDNAASTELTGRLPELRDQVRRFFRSRTAMELRPENEERLKQDLLEMLNTKILSKARARIITFNQLDVMQM